MSRKQLALLEPTLVRQALMDAVKTEPASAVAQPGDVYCLDWKFTHHRTGDCHGNGTPFRKCNLYRRHQPVAVVYRAVRQLCRSAGGRPQ